MNVSFMVMFSNIFVQAEDGIRDAHYDWSSNGALPILVRLDRHPVGIAEADRGEPVVERLGACRTKAAGMDRHVMGKLAAGHERGFHRVERAVDRPARGDVGQGERSEERRRGKEVVSTGR